MRRKLHKILVTGGAGFIGSEFVRQLTRQGYTIVVVDKLTYAGDLKRLSEVRGKYRFYKTDICNKAEIDSIFKKESPHTVVNFAAESHVDRSIKDASAFIETNVKGTQVLLEASRKYKIEKFIQVSTDEVYGEIMHGKFNEGFPLKPNSPYSASKAAADLLVRSYVRTYDFPAIIIRACNNYGPWQYPEKFIPVIIYNALNNIKVPVYAQGLNVREWLYVADCAAAIHTVLKKGMIGEVYNIGSSHEEKNIDVAKGILDILGKPHSLISFVKDRPGHDYRYFLDSSKIKRIGWKTKIGFKAGMAKTTDWYKENIDWLKEKAGSSLKITHAYQKKR